MTVAELIKLLNNYADDAKVIIDVDSGKFETRSVCKKGGNMISIIADEECPIEDFDSEPDLSEFEDNDWNDKDEEDEENLDDLEDEDYDDEESNYLDEEEGDY